MPQIRNPSDVFKKYSASKELEAGDDDLGPWVEVNASEMTTSLVTPSSPLSQVLDIEII